MKIWLEITPFGDLHDSRNGLSLPYPRKTTLCFAHMRPWPAAIRLGTPRKKVDFSGPRASGEASRQHFSVRFFSEKTPFGSEVVSCARQVPLRTTTLPKRLKSKEYKFYVLNSTVDKFMRYLHRQTNLQFPVMHKPGCLWSLRGVRVENF